MTDPVKLVTPPTVDERIRAGAIKLLREAIADVESGWAGPANQLAAENTQLRKAIEVCAAEFDVLSRDCTKTNGAQVMWKIIAERVRHILEQSNTEPKP